MSNYLWLMQALTDLERNPEQYDAVHERGHCVVLAGPGSGKTKTLTTAMARTLAEDVIDPRGVACITYNNECAQELETRLGKLGVMSDGRNFIGTVHSFALTQVITPYARCIKGLLPDNFRVATVSETRAAVEVAYYSIFDDPGNPHTRWSFAQDKRRSDVDRSLPGWRESKPELTAFIEAYEAELRRNGLIDFDDMPLIAFRIIKEHQWVRDALCAKFPTLFVDEYQDLGHALHELVLLLCFEGGIRLFAVGDADQSIYSFTGANPTLLQKLTNRKDVRTIRLRFNYRSGARIIRASLGALGEERDYRGVDGVPDGELAFCPVPGSLGLQAQYIAETIVPSLLFDKNYPPEQIAILYRAAWHGDKVAGALKQTETAFVRTDKNALVKRNSPFARFIEDCASWVAGGWRDATPLYSRLLKQAQSLVYGGRTNDIEQQALTLQLITFLRSGIDQNETTHSWLRRFNSELIEPWRSIARSTQQEWQLCSEMIEMTDPLLNRDMPLAVFSGGIDGSGRITLSTLHSAKGREFDAVILFGVDKDCLPNSRELKSERALREARRLFYVGVTRPRKELLLVFQEGNYSPWVKELYQRSQQT